jgi:Tim10/DDP family zinc finger
MGWFGGDSKKEDNSSSLMGGGGGGSFSSDYGMEGSGSNMYSQQPSSSLGGGGGGAGSMSELEQFSLMLQQQMLIQQAISELTNMSFETCVPAASRSNDGTLSGSEVSCIHSTVNKWIDTNEYMLGRLQRKQQQQQK